MIFNYLYMGTLTICFFLGTCFFYILNKETKVIWLLVFVTFIVEWLGFYNQFISEQHRIKPILYQIFSPIEALLFSVYFIKILTSRVFIKAVYILVFIALVIFTLDLLKNRFISLQNFKYYIFPIVFYVLFSLFYLKELLDSSIDINSNPNFWIVTGILFFYSGFFFLSGFINFIAEKDLPLAKKLYSINHIINIIYYSLITYGFICQRRLAKSSS